ncbi:MAG TPA: hypothetical protein VEU94_09325, partial [Terriglobales bacterium]|nr:hypothetical protein [Terriglobales bacterium]
MKIFVKERRGTAVTVVRPQTVESFFPDRPLKLVVELTALTPKSLRRDPYVPNSDAASSPPTES